MRSLVKTLWPKNYHFREGEGIIRMDARVGDVERPTPNPASAKSRDNKQQDTNDQAQEDAVLMVGSRVGDVE